MDYTQTVSYVPIAVLIIYSLLDIKRVGGTVFILKVCTIVDIVATRLKLSTKRQPFQVGYTNLGEDEIFERLIKLGYQWDYLAYHDEGEIISMRRLYHERQIHVRVYKDGEIRVHDELNYEFDPVGHLRMPASVPEPAAMKEVIAALDTMTSVIKPGP